MANINYGVNLNPFSAMDSIFDFSGNKSRADAQSARDNARADRYERRDVDRYYYEWEVNRQRYREAKKRQDNQLQRLVKDAQAAGISPLAALGSPGQAPINMSMPSGQGGRAGGTYISKPYFDQNVNKIMEVSAGLDMIHKAKQIKKVDAEAEAIKTSVRPQTNFITQPEQQVVYTDKYHDTGSKPSATTYNLEGGEIEGPSEDWPDLDQWLTWWIANQFSMLAPTGSEPTRAGKRLTRRGYR